MTSFDSLSAFFAMGGHGVYVWLSYGSALLCLGGLVLLSRQHHQRWLREQRALQRRQAGRRREPVSSISSPEGSS